jgi:hypothetical protein
LVVKISNNAPSFLIGCQRVVVFVVVDHCWEISHSMGKSKQKNSVRGSQEKKKKRRSQFKLKVLQNGGKLAFGLLY